MHPEEHSNRCYSRGCRHVLCLKAHNEYEKERKKVRQGRRGPWHAPVEAGPIRDRLNWLKTDCNLGIRAVAKKTGLLPSTLSKIKNGKVKKVTFKTAQKIMSVPTDYYAPAEEAGKHLRFLSSEGIGTVRVSLITGINRGVIEAIKRDRIKFTYKGNVDKILGLGTHMFDPNWRHISTKQRSIGCGIVKEYRKG